MTSMTQMSTNLARPVRIEIIESNGCDETHTFHSLKALAEWAEYEISCYVASRAAVQLALDAFTVDIISGRCSFRTFQIECNPYEGYEGPRVWTRYNLYRIVL